MYIIFALLYAERRMGQMTTKADTHLYFYESTKKKTVSNIVKVPKYNKKYRTHFNENELKKTHKNIKMRERNV